MYITLSINLRVKILKYGGKIIMWSGYRVIILTVLTVDPVKSWFI